MSQFSPNSVFALSATVLFSLACGASVTATQPTTLTHTLEVGAIASTVDSNTDPLIRTTVSTALIAQATGNLLSSEQKARLTRLPIPIVAPTNLPAGFRLVQAGGEAGQYVNGDDDSGYAIDYQGENNTCLSIRSSQDGPRGLEKVRQVQTRFGLITVYAEKLDGRKSLVSFLGIKGNPVLISGSTLPDSTAVGGWKRCRAVSVETYTQVLKSLTVVR
ncbi:hypothetical protein [Stenomitos frigidus]|uniref:hypothetical protein n=1 Tax=Stenomitos frigidus TaxID=1886765 RepID=UPI0015E780DA|nr:hypothetical protein [Stenomitos frigidus]